MTSQDERRLIRDTIWRLKRHRHSRFGRRPCSYYRHLRAQEGRARGRSVFVSHVLKRTLARTVIGASTDLTRAQKTRLNESVDWADRFGEWVTTGRLDALGSEGCRRAWEQRLKLWAQRRLPAYCWSQVDLDQVVADLAGAVQAHLGGYAYQRSFFAWAVPFLNAQLIEWLEWTARTARPAVDVPALREALSSRVPRLLDRLRAAYGAYGIAVEDVVERALLVVLRAEDEAYQGNLGRIEAWALERAADQVRLWIHACWAPDLRQSWGIDAATDACELRKRRELLKTFLELCQQDARPAGLRRDKQTNEPRAVQSRDELEACLDQVVRQCRVEAGLSAAGQDYEERQATIARLKEDVLLEVRAQGEEDPKAQCRLARRLFLDTLLGRGIMLPANEPCRAGAHAGGIHEGEAVTLWLAAFREQTFGLAGLWQLYLDLHDETIAAPKTDVALPPVVVRAFDPQGLDGENQKYLSQIIEQARPHIDLSDQQTSKIVAWVLETHLYGRPPEEAARELEQRGNRLDTRVDQNRRRGEKTLTNAFVRRVYQAIDNWVGTRADKCTESNGG